MNGETRDPVSEAAARLAEAASARKCWTCGCLRETLQAIERAYPEGNRPAVLDAPIRAARARLLPARYDCLGCEVCFPALAVNALDGADADRSLEVRPCPANAQPEREGWPPLPGDYMVLRYQAPVAVCALTSGDLAKTVAREASLAVAIVGTLQTENLGIERLIRNVLSNPNLRFLLLCGADSRQAIGHLPGQSLLALARFGLDGQGRIAGAAGRRPVLKNVTRDAVEHFRRSVEVIDLVGREEPGVVLDAERACGARDPGPAEPFGQVPRVPSIPGYVPGRMVPDPAGYFVVSPDRARCRLILEHYQNDGVLDAVIEASAAAEAYVPAVERGLLTRLDHAAYLGRELARAERALLSGEAYVQDAAPEASGQGPGHRRGATCQRDLP